MQKFLKNDIYEILTDEGFEDFGGLLIQEKELNLISFENTTIEATSDHRFMNESGGWDYVENFSGSTKIKYAGKFISSKSIGIQKVYDPINVTSSKYISGDLISHNCSMVYIDETSMIENWEDFSASVLPVLSSGKETILILTSTPNGLNHFYYYCEGAKAYGTDKWNGFEYIETKWYEVPGRDAAWKAGVMADIGYDMNRFEREYECSFQGSTGCLISGNALRLMKGIDPIFKTDEGMKQYSRPEKDKKYILIADSSDGKGLDYSTFSIFDISKLPYEQVCTFRSNNTTPTDFALTIKTVGKLYNDAYVLVENNNMGSQVASLLWEIHEYEYLVRTENMGRGGKQITFTADRRSEIGVKTTNPLKMLGCSLLKLLIEQNQMIIHDKQTIDELGSFIKKGAGYEADQGKHDDTVTPLWLFSWITQTKFWVNMIEQNVFDGMRELDGTVVDNMIREMSRSLQNTMENALNPEAPKYEIIGDDAWFDAGVEVDEWQHSF